MTAKDPVTQKVGESLVIDRPTEPAPPSSEAAGPPSRGVVCRSCGQSNHEGVSRCVFCGEPATSEAGPSVPPATPSSGGRWVEGPDSDADDGPASDGESEPPPSVRRASMMSQTFEEMGQPPIADPLIGVVVAERYRILELLGRGGMGIVYKVEHIRIGKLLAMKLLTGELSRNPDVVRRFKHEALTASKLSSPNTVQVFDFGVSDGLTYLVMELVAGEDLGRILRALGPMPCSRLGKIMIQACTSLAEAHAKGIVHRDVKPENIMLIRARDGTDIAKVLDFGLAKLREGSDLNDVTSHGAIVGTPYFMAPEQVRGEQVDSRADIYALGGLMYRALTGHYPFNGPTPMSVFTKHLTETPPSPCERMPELDIPAGVSRLVMKALSKNPADRFQKVEELQAALVDEIRGAGQSSIDALLDSGAMRKLAKVAAQTPEAAIPGLSQAPVEIATRDEVEAYERKLRRQRWVALSIAAVILLGAAGAAVRVATLQRADFNGVEVEPNDTAAEATPIPVGLPVRGMLGKRLDQGNGDRDFFSFEVKALPSGGTPAVKVSTTALPNFATCTFLYKQGLSTPLAQYCVGRAGRDLVILTLRLEPGRYLAAVMQDRDPYGASVTPFVHENVSDSYELRIEPTVPEEGKEVEPNDQIASANTVLRGHSITGAIGWARDEDVFCVPADAKGSVRFKARDVLREAGAVLEVTPVSGGEEGAPVRIHSAGKGARSAADVLGSWNGPALAEGTAHCLRVRLVGDPWLSGSSPTPAGGVEPYTIDIEAP